MATALRSFNIILMLAFYVFLPFFSIDYVESGLVSKQSHRALSHLQKVCIKPRDGFFSLSLLTSYSLHPDTSSSKKMIIIFVQHKSP